jgi:hypothetical protein
MFDTEGGQRLAGMYTCRKTGQVHPASDTDHNILFSSRHMFAPHLIVRTGPIRPTRFWLVYTMIPSDMLMQQAASSTHALY